MAIPLDEGPPDRRRVGPFWIEEGTGALVLGAFILLVFIGLFLVAFAGRPT